MSQHFSLTLHVPTLRRHWPRHAAYAHVLRETARPVVELRDFGSSLQRAARARAAELHEMGLSGETEALVAARVANARTHIRDNADRRVLNDFLAFTLDHARDGLGECETNDD